MVGGRDTGYASNRHDVPTAAHRRAATFHFQTWAEFEGFVHDQKKTGIIDHISEVRWDIRLASHLGTIRCASSIGCPTSRSSRRSSLTHCLIVGLDPRAGGRRVAAHHAAPWHVRENKLARGPIRPGRDHHLDADSNERLVTGDLGDMLTRLEPVARSLNCVDELSRVADIPRLGASISSSARSPRNTTAICARWSDAW